MKRVMGVIADKSNKIVKSYSRLITVLRTQKNTKKIPVTLTIDRWPWNIIRL